MIFLQGDVVFSGEILLEFDLEFAPSTYKL